MKQDEPWWHEADGSSNMGDDSSGHRSNHGTGPEEAAKLFGAMRDRFLSDPAAMKAGLQVMDLMSTFRGSGANAAAPGDAPECAYCPVCQAITRAQGISPESVETVTAAAINFVDALKQAMTGDSSESDDGDIRHVPLDEDEDDPDHPDASKPEPDQ